MLWRLRCGGYGRKRDGEGHRAGGLLSNDELIDQFPDALIAVSASGTVIFWSRGAEELFGYSRGEATGRLMAELIVPVDQHEEEARMLRSALLKERVVFEATRRRKDGAEVEVDVAMRAVLDAAGNVSHVAISKKDVSPLRYRREAAVVEARFRGLLDAVPDAMVLVNAQGRVVLVNKEAERLFGYRPAELIGQPIEVLVPESARAGHPAHRKGYAHDPKTRPMGAGLDLSARRRDGTEFPAEISLSQVQLPEGSFTSAAIRDVTRRRGVEARFRGLLEAAPDAIVIVNQTGSIVLVNAQAERLFGYTRDELVGKSVDLLVPEASRPGHGAHRSGYFRGPKARSMGSGLELEASRKDGSRFPVEISLSPLETEDGTLVSSAIRDVSERKHTETALRLAYKELESFSYSIAHDLRAPLRAMNGFAQVLLDDHGPKLDASGLEALDEIRSNAVRMGEQIDALLSLSRVARSEMKRERVDLGAMAQAVANRCAAAEPGRAVDFSVTGALFAYADGPLVRALLENLLQNAWKFTSRQSAARIEVGSEPHASGTAFFVRDNGAGFDEAQASRLFTPFQRLHAAAQFPGTGIGLATAQRIVHRHGGRIWARGAAGQGAIFFFTLPQGAA